MEVIVSHMTQTPESTYIHVPDSPGKSAIWMSKYWQRLFFLMQKIFIFPEKLPMAIFGEKWQFLAIFLKKYQFLAIFRHSNDNFPDGQVCTLASQVNGSVLTNGCFIEITESPITYLMYYT